VIDWLGRADLSTEQFDEETTDTTDAGSRAVIASKLQHEGSSVVGKEPADLTGKEPGDPQPFQGRHPKHENSGTQQLSGYCGLTRDPDTETALALDPEESEWIARQQQTGAAGRLVVYEQGELPRRDFLLRGGSGRRIMVAAVTDGGKAAQAGVKPGDVLVSIDGRKGFSDQSADQVHANLRSPVLLVFMGFVGKLQAEVRLNYKQKICGLSSQHPVVLGRGDAPMHVMDEVVFQLGSAALLLTTQPAATQRPDLSSERAGAVRVPGDDGDVHGELDDIVNEMDEHHGGQASSSSSRAAAIAGEADEVNGDLNGNETGLAAVYELRGPEARHLVSRALSKAQISLPVALGHAPPGSLPEARKGDHANAPRSLATTTATFAGRFENRRTQSHGYSPAKPFHFTPAENTPAENRPAEEKDGDRPYCDVTSWWTTIAPWKG
jgi:hypothetical protein